MSSPPRATRFAAILTGLALVFAACSRGETALNIPTSAPAADNGPASAAAGPPVAPAAATAPVARAKPAQPARTASALATSRVGLLRQSGSPEGPISYLVVEPAAAPADLPLVIALHGRGDTADAFAGLAEALDQPTRTLVGRAPIPFGTSGGRQWYSAGAPDEAAQVRARVAELATLARQLAARYPKAPKPALYGFSQGAVLALQAAADHPELWSAVVALSGHLPSTEGSPRAAGPLPILIVAGAKDGVIPAERSWQAAAALVALGHAPERFAFDGPHRIPAEAVDALRAFLARHVLGAAPAP